MKKQRHYFANKGPSSQSYGFSNSHVWMWELDYKESWVPKNWCFWTMVLEKTLESPLNCKEIQPVHPKWDQSWMFIGRTDAEAETPILWPPDAKNWLTGKDPDVGKDWSQREKGTTEVEMAGWHHQLDGFEFEQALGIGDGQESLACCSPWGRKESDMTEQLNSTFVSRWDRQNCASSNFFINSIFASKVEKIILLCQIGDILEERHSEFWTTLLPTNFWTPVWQPGRTESAFASVTASGVALSLTGVLM